MTNLCLRKGLKNHDCKKIVGNTYVRLKIGFIPFPSDGQIGFKLVVLLFYVRPRSRPRLDCKTLASLAFK